MSTRNSATSGSLTKLHQALAVADRVASSLANVTSRRTLNKVEVSGTTVLSSVAIRDLEELLGLGQTVEVEIKLSTWYLRLRRGRGEINTREGSISEAVEQARIGDLEAALDGRDFAGALALLQSHTAIITMSIANDPAASGTHWIARLSDVQREIQSTQWVPFARHLQSGPSGLLIDDLGDVVLSSDALTVYGPDADVGSLDSGRWRDAGAVDLAFRSGRSPEGGPLPSPVSFYPLRRAAGTEGALVDQVEALFDDLAYLLSWALLATTATPVAGGIAVHVSGVRELDLTVAPPPSSAERQAQVVNLIDIYRWVSTSPEVDRLYFVQQALTLAILNDADVHTAAGAALRNAKSLYELSRRNSVAEVMSSRRSAREIAQAASRTAATQARDASGKAVERTVALVAAAAGILIARIQADMPTALTIGLLILVAVICAASWAVTEHITLASARRGFTKELSDLDQYRDSLSEEDLAEIKNSGAIGAANADLTGAQTAARWVLGAGGVLALIAALGVGVAASDVLSSPDPAPKQPSKTTTTSPTPNPSPTGRTTTPTKAPSTPSKPSRSPSKQP